MSWSGFPNPCFTINFCPNPSAETSTAGYTPLHAASAAAETVWQADYAQSGSFSVGVTTPGTVPGEGVATPPGSIIASTTGAVSLYVYGPAGLVLTVSAVTSDGTTQATTQATMTGLYQQVVFDNVTMTSGLTIQALVQTTEAEATGFLVDCVQYEPEATANPYIDGDAYGCTWTGTAGLSPSYQQFQFPVMATGGLITEGSASFINIGEVFSIGNASPAAGPVVLIVGQLDCSGVQHPMVATSSPARTPPTTTPPTIDPGVAGLPWEVSGGGWVTSISLYVPPGRVSDFAAWATGSSPNTGLGDHDPAKCLIGQNNAGISSGGTQDIGGVNTGAYSQPFAVFTPPADQPSSSAQYLWNRAAFMAAGFKVASQAAYVSATQPGAVNFTDIEVQQAAVTPGVTPAPPSAYSYPRSLKAIVRPTLVNLCPNPSVEVSTSGWTGIGTTTVSQDTTTAYDTAVTGSSASLLVAATSGGGAYVTVPDLVYGDVYTALAYVRVTASGISSITAIVGSESAAVQPVQNGWAEVVLTFTAPYSTVQLGFQPSVAASFWIDCVMVTPGEAAPAYGDGGYTGWEWEEGGTAGLSRSYYYERQNVASKAVTAVLDQHVPLGLSYSQPLYCVPWTQ
jgi:hypothetical protein